MKNSPNIPIYYILIVTFAYFLQVLNQLNSMEGDIRNANAAMAGELGPLARQKADPILRQGRSLSQRLGTSDVWTISIDHKTKEIEQKLTAIESLAASRGREVMIAFFFN